MYYFIPVCVVPSEEDSTVAIALSRHPVVYNSCIILTPELHQLLAEMTRWQCGCSMASLKANQINNKTTLLRLPWIALDTFCSQRLPKGGYYQSPYRNSWAFDELALCCISTFNEVPSSTDILFSLPWRHSCARPSLLFPYCKATKLWVGSGNEFIPTAFRIKLPPTKSWQSNKHLPD